MWKSRPTQWDITP